MLKFFAKVSHEQKTAQQFFVLEFKNMIARKITPPLQVIDKLKDSEVLYRRRSDVVDGILVVDPSNGQILEINPYLENLLGYGKHEVVGRKIIELSSIKDPALRDASFKILKKKRFAHYDNFPLETKDGKPIDIEFVNSFYLDTSKQVLQCNIRDISQRRREEAAMEVKRMLEQEMIKAAFIADATHELRTPLAIIRGNVDLGLKKESSKAHKSPIQALRAINTEVKHLTNLLADLTLLTAKDYKFKSEITFHDVNLTKLLNKSVKRCETISQKKKIKIIIKKIPKVSIYGDFSYLEKLFVNIIMNAVIYGDEKGWVLISGTVDKAHVHISISDNGPGIPKNDLPHIFERFYRVEKSRTSSKGGTGLGLAIVKWIAEMHGGKVAVESSLGKGATFIVSLPKK